MAQGRRVERVASLIRREVSQLLINGIRDHRVNEGLITITEVEVSGDLQHCRIFISILGDKEQKTNVLEGLQAATGFIRGEIGRRLKMRRVPEVVIQLDRGIEKGASVLNLLSELKVNRELSGEKSSDSEAI